jgi:hypothetical protein
MSWTGRFIWTKDMANERANNMTKEWGEYHTSIKGEPAEPLFPDECWAVTDKFDVRRRKDTYNYEG